MDTKYDYPSLTVEQVAERIGVCPATLYRMLQRGTAPTSYRIGARRYWRESDVISWLERHCRDAGSAAGAA